MNHLTLAAVLMIASGSIHAVVNAIVKGGRDKMAGRALTDGSSAILMLPAILLVPLPTGAWGWLVASGLLHAFYLWALVRAYQVGDLSAVYPVLRGTAPLLTALVTLGILGEPASAREILGIALIGAAMFAMIAGRHLGRGALGWALLTGGAGAGACAAAAAASPWARRRLFSCILLWIWARAAPRRALAWASSASARDSSARLAASAYLRSAIADCASWNLSWAKPRSTGA